MKYDWNKTTVENAVKSSDSLSDTLRFLNIPILGNNSKTLKNKIKEYNIDISHFTYGVKKRKGIENYIPVEKYLHKNSNIKSFKLKEKLLKEGLKINKCECCGITEWQGKLLTILLHHIDGDNTNNELGNLQMLCPNCHSLTETYCGNANIRVKHHCRDCGKEISRGAVYCNACRGKHNRKVDRPSKDQLIADFKEIKSILGIGKKYLVSDAAIKKWLKEYNLPTHIKKLKELYL